MGGAPLINLRQMGRIARHEFSTTLRRRGVWLAMVGMPLLSLLLLSGCRQLFARSAGVPTATTGSGTPLELLRDLATDAPAPEAPAPPPIGVVDETGRLAGLLSPHSGPLRLYPNLATAERAYASGELAGFYRLPADYLAQGRIQFYGSDELAQWETAPVLQRTLIAAFVSRDPDVVNRVLDPVTFRRINLLEGSDGAAAQTVTGIVVAALIAMLFFLTVMGTAGYLLQGLAAEKQNRVLELLLTSARPFELLLAKLLALGAIGLLHLLAWLSLTIPLLRGSWSEVQLSLGGLLPVDLAWPSVPLADWGLILVYFLVGYFLYASFFAALGALAPTLREASQYTLLFVLPVLLPLLGLPRMVAAPNGSLATTLSLVPLSSPLVMPIRLALGSVPFWQVALGLLLTAGGALLSTALVARLFRAQTLLSGQRLTPRLIWRALR